MKILHCCLSCFYIDNYNYQENVLPRQNKMDGHEVMILASTETFIDNNSLGYIKPSKYVNEDGIDVIRIPYSSILPSFIMRKLRIYKNTLKYIKEFNPDVILFHGGAAYDIIEVAKYKEINPNVKIYVDCHEDFNNSARNFLSKEILHKIFYKRFIHKVLPYIEKVLCISVESYNFMKDFYKIPSGSLELYPLGGTIFEGEKYESMRKQARNELQLKDSDILLVHSGKMSRLKRTPELLEAFTSVTSVNINLVLIGSVPEEMNDELMKYVTNDDRVKFLGWKSPEELFTFLCGADLYLQPGSQSATLQNAICCGCPVMIYPHESHKPYLNENGFYVKSIDDMVNVFNSINNNPEVLKNMRQASYEIAHDLLDYRKLASRLYE